MKRELKMQNALPTDLTITEEGFFLGDYFISNIAYKKGFSVNVISPTRATLSMTIPVAINALTQKCPHCDGK